MLLVLILAMNCLSYVDESKPDTGINVVIFICAVSILIEGRMKMINLNSQREKIDVYTVINGCTEIEVSD